MIGDGYIAAGQLRAVLIGAAEFGVVIYAMARRPRRERRGPVTASRPSVPAGATVRRRAPRPRAWACEEVIARQRLAGQIDATTDQAPMTDVVRGNS